jgi:hypothetical protein
MIDGNAVKLAIFTEESKIITTAGVYLSLIKKIIYQDKRLNY